MQALLARLMQKLGMPRSKLLHVAGVQPLAAGLVVYAIDVDGRRIILGVSPRSLCVLDRYRTPETVNPAGPTPAHVQTRQEMMTRHRMSNA